VLRVKRKQAFAAASSEPRASGRRR